MHVNILVFRSNYYIHIVCMPSLVCSSAHLCMPSLVCSSAHSHKVINMPKLRSAYAVQLGDVEFIATLEFPPGMLPLQVHVLQVWYSVNVDVF